MGRRRARGCPTGTARRSAHASRVGRLATARRVLWAAARATGSRDNGRRIATGGAAANSAVAGGNRPDFTTLDVISSPAGRFRQGFLFGGGTTLPYPHPRKRIAAPPGLFHKRTPCFLFRRIVSGRGRNGGTFRFSIEFSLAGAAGHSGCTLEPGSLYLRFQPARSESPARLCPCSLGIRPCAHPPAQRPAIPNGIASAI